MTQDNWLIVLSSSTTFWLVIWVCWLPLRHKTIAARRLIVCCAGGFVLQILAGVAVCIVPTVYWLLYVLNFLLAFLTFQISTDVRTFDVIYCTIWTMIVHRIGFQIWQLVMMGLWILDVKKVWALVLGILAMLIFYAAFGFTLARWMPETGRYDVGPRQLTAAILSFAAFEFLVFVWETSWQLEQFSSMWKSTIMMEVYCATLLYLQHEMFKKSALRQELDILNRIKVQQKEQYNLAKENIALINRKCHDLKHQVKAMRLMFDDDKRESYLQELESAVGIYEAIAKTGNEVLDTVLTEKSLYCEANSIKAHCVADGRLLDFMDPVDLYTIFGNAMDNAIDSVKKLQETEKRIIDVLVYQENQFLVIQVINPVEGTLQFDEEGLPLTTKSNKGYHGFGLKSIRHTIQKYGGFLTIKIENGCFCLRILLPMQTQKES